MGYLFLSMLLLLLHQATTGSTCKVPVDCAAVAALPGVDIIPCPQRTISIGTGEGSGSVNAPIPVVCCQSYTYDGPGPQKYIYDTSDSTCPVALEITNITPMNPGEVVTIRNNYCLTDPDDCTMYTIDSDAVGTTPFIIMVSNSNFKFSSEHDVDITFNIKNIECNSCLPPNDQVECQLPIWYRHGSFCYHPRCTNANWSDQRHFCEVTHAQQYPGSTFARIDNQGTLNFLKNVGLALDPNAKLFLWIGLYNDTATNQWKWATKGSPDEALTFTNIWDDYFPRGANADCGGIQPVGKVRNAGCDVEYFGWCQMPAP